MDVSFDSDKRAETLEAHWLAFADAPRLFATLAYTRSDDRFDYPEPPPQTYRLLDERLIMVVGAETEDGRFIISTRKYNKREQGWFGQRLG